MRNSKQKRKSGHKILRQFPIPFNIFSIISLIIRGPLFILIFCYLLVCQHYLIPLLIFPKLKRFASCFTNLILCYSLLIILGFVHMKTKGFQFFKDYSQKIRIQSGYIGLAIHKNIIDFIYYCFIMNPIFTKIIVVKNQKTKRRILYQPLTYIQAWKAAFSYRGFQPIIVQSEEQLKKLRIRKLEMETLVRESFEDNGPILILLPGINPNINIPIDLNILVDIQQNELMNQRITVGFDAHCEPTDQFNTTYVKQSSLILKLLCSLSLKTLIVYGKYLRIGIRRFQRQRQDSSYLNFIQSIQNPNYLVLKRKLVNLTYEEYVEIQQQLQQQKQLRVKEEEKQQEKKQKKIKKKRFKRS